MGAGKLMISTLAKQAVICPVARRIRFCPAAEQITYLPNSPAPLPGDGRKNRASSRLVYSSLLCGNAGYNFNRMKTPGHERW